MSEENQVEASATALIFPEEEPVDSPIDEPIQASTSPEEDDTASVTGSQSEQTDQAEYPPERVSLKNAIQILASQKENPAEDGTEAPEAPPRTILDTGTENVPLQTLRAHTSRVNRTESTETTPQDRKSEKDKKKRGLPSPDQEESEKRQKLAGTEAEISEKLEVYIRSKITKLKRREVKNTATEIKLLHDALIRGTDKFKEELFALVREHVEEIKKNSPANLELEEQLAETITELEKCRTHATELQKTLSNLQTENQKLKEEKASLSQPSRQKSDEEAVAEIQSKLASITSLDEMAKLAKEHWPETLFSKTYLVKTGIASDRNLRVFIHKEGDDDLRTGNIINELSKFFPAIREMDELEAGETAIADMITSPKLRKSNGPTQPEGTKTLIVGKLRKEATSADLAELIQNIATELAKGTYVLKGGEGSNALPANSGRRRG